jgi:hypothetical protein
MDHSGLEGQCASCHSGAYLAQNAQMKPITHTPTTAQCDTCHTGFTSWATAVFNHATASPPVAGRCSTCHTPGGGGLSKPTNHIPTSQQCDSCHKNFVAFRAPVSMNHTGTAGQCTTCHNGSYLAAGARKQSTNHIPDSRQCDACHTNTLAFKPAVMNHTGLTSQCATCHNGGYARGKPVTHIPTSRNCDACHRNTVAFAPSTMDHTGLAGQCITCHSGAYLAQNAQMKPVTHTPTTAQCDACHTGFVTWATATFNHATAVPAVAGRCSTCHTPGGGGLSKPTNHIPTAVQCDSCHLNTTRFAPAIVNHAVAGIAGQCSTCHNGAYLFAGAKNRNTTHIPDTRQCDTCHNTNVFKPAAMNHTGTAGQCRTCHNGAYTAVNALAKPVNHIPFEAQLLGGGALNCDACHKGTTVWTSQAMNHNGSQGNGSGFCKGCHLSGTSYLGSLQKKSLNHTGSKAVVTDCSQSGCHRPLGNRGSPYSSW